MDPGKLAKSLVQKYFPKFGSIRKDFIYVELDTTNYDASNGVAEQVLVSQTPITPIIDMVNTSALTNMGIRDDDPDIKKFRVCLVPALDLPNVIPSIGDELFNSYERWSVVGMIEDPALALYTLIIKPV